MFLFCGVNVLSTLAILVSPNAIMVTNYHNPKSSKKYTYLKSLVIIDGNPCRVKIDLANTPQRNTFYIHRIEVLQNKAAFALGYHNDFQLEGQSAAYNNNYAQYDEKVNTSDKNNDGTSSFALYEQKTGQMCWYALCTVRNR